MQNYLDLTSLDISMESGFKDMISTKLKNVREKALKALSVIIERFKKFFSFLSKNKIRSSKYKPEPTRRERVFLDKLERETKRLSIEVSYFMKNYKNTNTDFTDSIKKLSDINDKVIEIEVLFDSIDVAHLKEVVMGNPEVVARYKLIEKSIMELYNSLHDNLVMDLESDAQNEAYLDNIRPIVKLTALIGKIL